MAVSGLEEMLNNVQILEDGFDKKARKAVRDGGNIFKEKLMEDTPQSVQDHSGLGPLKEHTKVINSTRTGEYEAQVGYDNIKGRIAHFPNSGTSKQDPQHCIEKAQEQTKQPILDKFLEDLKL